MKYYICILQESRKQLLFMKCTKTVWYSVSSIFQGYTRKSYSRAYNLNLGPSFRNTNLINSHSPGNKSTIIVVINLCEAGCTQVLKLEVVLLAAFLKYSKVEVSKNNDINSSWNEYYRTSSFDLASLDLIHLNTLTLFINLKLNINTISK